MRRITTLALTSAIMLGACDSAAIYKSVYPEFGQPGFTVAPTNAPQGAAVDNFARAFLDNIQAASIQDRVEYCGYFFVDDTGQLFGTPPVKGTFAGCETPVPRPGQGIIANYHTHGAYSPEYDNEVPSFIDLEAVFQFGIDGYVSTPGGRVWLIDFQTKSTHQTCGRNCVYTDPNFVPQRNDNIRQSYTLPTLHQRQLNK